MKQEPKYPLFSKPFQELIDIQLNLEDEMVDYGVSRYNKQRDDEAMLSPGRKLISRSIPKMVDAINEFITKANSGKAGRRHTAVPYFEQSDPEVMAYLTCRSVINAMIKEGKTLSTATGIGSLLESNSQLSLLEVDHKGLLESTLQKIKTRNTRHRHNAMQRAVREAGVKGLQWSERDKALVGSKLIEMFIEVTGLCEDEIVRTSRRHSYHVLRPTPKVKEWIENAHDEAALLAPLYLPMVVPPRPWKNPRSGGYLNGGALKQVTMVRTLQRESLDDVFSIDMPEVYDSLNRIQGTPWRVNKSVLDVFLKIRNEQSPLGGLPFGDDESLPPRPVDIAPDVPLGELTKDQQVRLKIWKAEAAQTYQRNSTRRSKLLAVAQTARVATQFVDFEEIFFPHSLDFRGRIYSIPTGLSPQGDDLSKGLLSFAYGKPLGEDGAYWLAVHVANVFGEADKLPLDERAQWTLDNEELILDSAFNPIEGQCFWATADGDSNPWTALAACHEWAGYVTSGRSEDYVSNLPVAMDGSCSGLQHFSAMLRDPIGAEAVNLMPLDICSDIYTKVAELVTLRLNASTCGDAAAMVSIWKDKVSRKIVKQPCMTFAYSVTSRGMRDQIVAALKKIDSDGNYLDGVRYHDAAGFLAPIVEDAIRDTVVAAAGAMDWLKEVAKTAASENMPLLWSTPTGFPVLQDKRKHKAETVNLWFQGSRVRFFLATPTVTVHKQKQASGVAPNFVHSMDASHLMKTVNAGADLGLKDFAMIHDSFGVHACDTTLFNNVIREEFVKMYSTDVLAKFKEQQDVRLLGSLPDVPPAGDFDLESVKESDFFFA